MTQNKRPYIYFPIIVALAMIGGIFMGRSGLYVGKFISPPSGHQNKLETVIQYIEKEYVDTVLRDELVDIAIQNVLQDLDPHSYYITAKELAALNEPLEGNFEGIGIEFSIQNDTVVVVSPVSGGPSEMLGILSGDRIVKVDNKLVAGTGITNKDVMNLLRGKGGTEVKVSIFRRGESKLLDFTIERDKIPIYSIDVAYMLTAETGYIKISRFSKKTYDEFIESAEKLAGKGMKKLVIDLRNNGGGYLDAATDLADEFLEKGKLIVYTEGKARAKKMHTATSKGDFETTELVVLIDEGSASASEIIAGAIQDNDRGTIVGRRSFGKGLVQEQSEWPDGSAIRLTIARYYTPTGRCIQKPYNNGSRQYYLEYYKRLERGELQSIDSIDFPDSLKYKTPGGKTVYGGGGIMPDVFVPIDTSGRSAYLSHLGYEGVFRNFSFDYADQNRQKLERYHSSENFNQSFSVDDDLYEKFIAFAEENGVKRNNYGISTSESRIKTRLKANIARYIWNNNGYFPVIHQQDNMIKRSLELLEIKKGA
ncbi:MAG: peptidase S41 [Flavobacteriales bacterium]|nr:S41 family peptidase [Bacteroidales bacterium AH-315-I05]PCJ89686.1 MAG: peptidase S41 [Flavobacteriales bacterium]